MDELLLSIESLDPKIANQLASFIHEYLGVCEHAGCRHPTIKHEQYRCLNCSDKDTPHFYCLAEHMVFINLDERFGDDFVQLEWLPDKGYFCVNCIIELDMLFMSHQVERTLL